MPSTISLLTPATVPVAPTRPLLPAAPRVGSRRFLGVPVQDVLTSPGGNRIVVALRGWGNNLLVFDATGRLLSARMAGKFFPCALTALDVGFLITEHENDPTTLYATLSDWNGRPIRRLAGMGRRIQGTRDAAVSHPGNWPSFLRQASFSVTADGSRAAVGGGKGVAVWDPAGTGTLLWRDDTIRHSSTFAERKGFPQVTLSPDGATLALLHEGVVTFRAGATGALLGTLAAPADWTPGPVRLHDGTRLVVGDADLLGYTAGTLRWRFGPSSGAAAVVAFAPDGLRYAVGESNGVIRLMQGGGQVAGYAPSLVSATSVAIAADGLSVAFGTTGGEVGILDTTGLRWVRSLGASCTAVARVGADVVAGDGRGILRRHRAADGSVLWERDLHGRVYRTDFAARQAILDAMPTLRVPPPTAATDPTVDPGWTNLALAATAVFTDGLAWWGGMDPALHPAALVNDGSTAPLGSPWFTAETIDMYQSVNSGDEKGGHGRSLPYDRGPSWTLEWGAPATFNRVVVHEHPGHAVPEEILIETWDGSDWETVLREAWVRGTVHAHTFAPATTTRLRYTPVGDLGDNVWISEIQVYDLP